MGSEARHNSPSDGFTVFIRKLLTLDSSLGLASGLVG